MDIYMAKIQTWAYDPDKDTCSVTKMSSDDMQTTQTRPEHQVGYGENVSFHRNALSASLCTFCLPENIHYIGMDKQEIEKVKEEHAKACNMILRGLCKPAKYYDTISVEEILQNHLENEPEK